VIRGHGEWTGDWSDSSEQWTKKWRAKLKYDDQTDDGTFWMSLEDFTQHVRTTIFIAVVVQKRHLTYSLISVPHGIRVSIDEELYAR
jgi:hypothetical protein